MRANPSDTGTIVSYRFYPTDQITFVTDNGQNYLTIDFVYNPQTETYVNGFNINGAEDNNCVNNTYDLVAIEVESGNSQTFKVKVGDADKCIFIATNNGAGYAGNFAKKGIDNDGLGAVEVADAICNANIPTGINKDVTYKAMIAATNSPASIRYPGSNWVFSSFTSYYSQSGLKLAKTFTSGTTIGFANAETWTNSLGTSGKIWTGFSSIDWGIDTPSATQCAGIYNAQGAQASWYSSSATGTQGVLSAVNGQSIAEMTTTDPATVIETICSAKRYIACVGQ
ncbi:DUF1554 domain-containing protein [Leptospira sarikeiensis]|uniref:DUF1554 domain-containing protein n=1 Tax=Leptospira sarikeiensis TaxID=2484943 RepID=UPI001FEAD62B|nr:DUF1554 domain-containing protein [Leptospira sarikeiensis]